MERAALERLEQQVREEVDKRFPGVALQVEVLQYGDEPVIEPGELMVRLTLEPEEGEQGAEAKEGEEAPEEKKGKKGGEGRERALHAFERAHGAALKHFRRDLIEQFPEAGRLEIRVGDDSERGARLGMMLHGRMRPTLEERALEGGGELTPVMARLGPVDLETLDALITAGIASSRAEAVRWALARIRERPAYAQLRERAAEIERLKTEF
jgi:hypothetical protein